MAAMLYPTRRVLAVCGEWDDPLEAGSGWISGFRHEFRQSRLRCLRQVLRHQRRPVESADGLVPALEAAFAASGVQLVAAPIDYSENLRVLVNELRANAAKNGEQS